MHNQPIKNNESYTSSNLYLISACGLYCGACGIYQATQENDTAKTLHYAVVLNQSYNETLCDGCGANRKSLHCSKLCTFIDCKLQKYINYCSECSDFPCKALLEFKSKMPHRIEMLESLKRLKEVGREKWLLEMKKRFSCTSCYTLNTAYDIICRKCGISPSSKFVSEHKEMIEKYLAK